MEKKVLGVYNTPTEALRAVEMLQEKGYGAEEINIISNRPDMNYVKEQTGATVISGEENHHEPEGFMEKLKDYFVPEDNQNSMQYSSLGISEDQVRTYQSDLDENRILILGDHDIDLEASLSSRHQEPYDGVSTRAEAQDGTMMDDALLDRDSYQGSMTGDAINRRAMLDGTMAEEEHYTTGKEETLQLHEEMLDINKEEVVTGEIGIGKRVVSERTEFDVPVTREEIYVERRPVNARSVDNHIINESDSLTVPIKEERVDVVKTPVLKEEIVVGKRTIEETEHITENIQREEAVIERDGYPLDEENYKKDRL